LDAGMIGIEPEAFVQILECEIEIALANITRAAAGIRRRDLRIEPNSLAEIGDSEVEITLEPAVLISP
jgi:hypothetical protein